MLETYWYKNYNSTLFGVLFVHNEYFLLLSLNVIIDEDCMSFEYIGL